MSDNHEAFDWVEPLPEGCPPAEAYSPNSGTFYRLVESVPPTVNDFYSFRWLNPNAPLRRSECVERACSLRSTLKSAENLRGLPRLRGKQIAEIVLPPESGLIQRTGQHHHVSWWWAQGFDPVSHCRMS